MHHFNSVFSLTLNGHISPKHCPTGILGAFSHPKVHHWNLWWRNWNFQYCTASHAKWQININQFQEQDGCLGVESFRWSCWFWGPPITKRTLGKFLFRVDGKVDGMGGVEQASPGLQKVNGKFYITFKQKTMDFIPAFFVMFWRGHEPRKSCTVFIEKRWWRMTCSTFLVWATLIKLTHQFVSRVCYECPFGWFSTLILAA